MTARVLIVDDEPLPRERLRTLLGEHDEVEIVGECADGESAVRSILELRPDLVLLDIKMPELDGFGVVEALKGEELPAIIFVTAYDEFAIRAFEVEAVDYLLKPINPERFARALGRALAALERPESGAMHKLQEFVERVERSRGFLTRFVVRDRSKLSFVRVEDVDWIDSASNYVRLHVDGRPSFVRETMKSIEARLDPDRFVRVHRSSIINIDRVASIEPSSHGEYIVTMRDGARLTTSRTHSERLRELLR
jgi:two-component system, LytTR family, response regulator